MTNTLSGFFSQLLTHPEIQELVQTHFEDESAQILRGMEQGSLGRDQADGLEELVSAFIIEHAAEVATFKGLGTSASSSSKAMANLQIHHPEAARLLQAQARELELLLGREQAAVALGHKREPFYIKVLCWADIYVVTADEFDNEWFNNKETAITFAQDNYDPFIRNAKRSGTARL